MKFIDHAKIQIQSGNGGKGAVSFRREKFIPKGGPDGGNGGKGGDVVLIAEKKKNTLLNFRFNQHFFAENGYPGEGKNKNGKDGKNLIIYVPIGTLIFDDDKNLLLCDLSKENDFCLLASGGRGGKGNAFFKSATHQAPKFSQPGESGVSLHLRLELKLLSDVSLIGLPNAGKSTIISVVSNSKPKIADYPFTTLIPNLGVVRFSENVEFVISDIPGLIKNAHLGAGLGIGFLKHIERTKILCHCIDIGNNSETDPLEKYKIIRNELESFNKNILKKDEVVILTKIDLISKEELSDKIEIFKKLNLKVFPISAVTKLGVEELIKYLVNLIFNLQKF